MHQSDYQEETGDSTGYFGTTFSQLKDGRWKKMFGIGLNAASSLSFECITEDIRLIIVPALPLSPRFAAPTPSLTHDIEYNHSVIRVLLVDGNLGLEVVSSPLDLVLLVQPCTLIRALQSALLVFQHHVV